MNLFQIVLTLVVVGFLLWAVLKYVPMPEPIGRLITAVVVIALVVFILKQTGLWTYVGNVKVR